MTLDVPLPQEFLVGGVPASAQASTATRVAWKAKVLAAARLQLPRDRWSLTEALSVTILYFSAGRMRGDLDNIVKPVLDALHPDIMLDDGQVDRLFVARFADDDAAVDVPLTPVLSSALVSARPVLYIQIDDLNRHGTPS